MACNQEPRILNISKCSHCPFALVPPGKGPIECGLSDPVKNGEESERRIITVPYQNGYKPPEFCPLQRQPVLVQINEPNKSAFGNK